MVAAVAMVVAALRPRVGLAILLLLMPFEFHFSGTGTNEVVIVAMALVLAWRIRTSAIPGWIAVGGLALVLGSFIAAIGAQDQTGALWGAVRWLAAIILLFAAISVFRGRRDASRRMIDLFTGSALVVVMFAFAQRREFIPWLGLPTSMDTPILFSEYTVYAGYTAIAAVLATGEIQIAVNQHRMSRAGVYGAALVVILIGIAMRNFARWAIGAGGRLAVPAPCSTFVVGRFSSRLARSWRSSWRRVSWRPPNRRLSRIRVFHRTERCRRRGQDALCATESGGAGVGRPSIWHRV